MKKYSLLGKGWKRRLEKIIQRPPSPEKKKKTFPPKKKVQSSLVQELVQKMFTKERKCKRDYNNSANAILSDSVLVKWDKLSIIVFKKINATM